jgi:hypothetical protein
LSATYTIVSRPTGFTSVTFCSAVRELSDFVAHREKDRGSLKTYVRHVVTYAEALVTKNATQLKVGVVHSAAAFRESLNTTLTKFNLAPLDPDVTDDVLACVMSLLQEVRLFHKGGRNRSPWTRAPQ